MINGVRLKVCGITSLVDAAAAAAVGADGLGFIFHATSPRNLALAQYAAMKDRLPSRKKVAVCVEPTPADLAALDKLGFDYFQIHFGADTPVATIAPWSQLVGRSRLWLAPKLPPPQDVKPEWLPLADTFLLDTFHPDKFGGTGETGDWEKFNRQVTTHHDKTWILSGGLTPENIALAIARTAASIFDVSSGVESAPGVKDAARLKALRRAIERAVPA